MQTAAKSQNEMVLGSVSGLLSSIATSNQSIYDYLKEINIDAAKKKLNAGSFSTVKMLIRIKNYSMVQTMRLGQINNILNNIYEKILKPNKNYENVSGTVNINFNGKKYKDAKDLLLKIRDILIIDDKKFDTVTQFFDNLNDRLAWLGPTAKNSASGLFLLAGALFLLNLATFSGIVKVGAMLLALGFSIGFFISSISKALKGTGNFKGYMILKMLPNFFSSLGLGILTMSLGLVIFSRVKGSAVSLAIMMTVIIGLFVLFKRKQMEGAGVRYGGPINNMVKFAAALGILALALYAIKDVPLKSILTLIGLIGALGLALKLSQGKKGLISGNKTSNSLIGQFAMGIGILVLALYAVKDIEFLSIFKLITFVGGLGLVLRLFKAKVSLVGFAVGFGILVLALYAFQTSIFIPTLFSFIAFMSALGLSLKLFNKSGLLTLGLIAASIYALSLSFKEFVQSKFGLSEMLILAGTVALLAVVVGIMGAASSVLLIGSVTLIAVAFGVSMIVNPLAKLSKAKIELINILNFVGSIGIIAIGLALATPFLLLALPASLLLIPLSASIYLASGGFVNIASMNFDLTNVNNFIETIKSISIGLSSIFLDILLAVPASIALIPIMVSLLMVGGLMKIISLIDFTDTSKTANFNNAVKSIINSVNNFGLITLGKTAAKSLLLLPIFTTLLLGAHLMKKIQEVDLNENQMQSFSVMVNDTVGLISNTVNANKNKLTEIAPGLEVLGKIFSVGGNIAKVVQNMASLTYDEYGVRNGKLYLKKRHKLTEDDFKSAGKNLGKIIFELVKPLNELGANSNTFSIGGFVFDNPFKDNSKSKGMDFIMRLGNAYLPLSESLVKLSQSGLLTNKGQVDKLINNIGKVTSGYISGLNEASKIDIVKSEKTLTQMIKLNELFEADGIKQVDKMSLSFEKIVNVFSDNKKWKLIRKNLKTLKDEFKDISKSLNSIEIEKINAFEKTVVAIAEANKGDIQELISKLAEFISVIQTRTFSGENQTKIAQIPNTVNNNSNITNIQKETEKVNNSNIELSNLFQQLIDEMNTINENLEGTLAVKVTNVDSNF